MGASPLDPGTAGYHLTPRAWRRSQLYAALRTAEARHVAELILFDRPRWEDEEVWLEGERFVVRRGQLFDSEEALARLAGTSRKVVRRVLRALTEARMVARERAHGGARSPWVTTIQEYELSQTLPERLGPRPGPRNRTEEARERASRKPQEPQEPQERSAHGPPFWRDLVERIPEAAWKIAAGTLGSVEATIHQGVLVLVAPSDDLAASAEEYTADLERLCAGMGRGMRVQVVGPKAAAAGGGRP